MDCLTLRKVSHDLQNLVDSWKWLEGITLALEDKISAIEFANVELVYKTAEDGGCQIILRRTGERKTEKVYKDERDFLQATLEDASMILKNPKMEISRIDYLFDANKKLPDFLKSLDFSLNVQSIRVGNLELYYSILPFLKVEKLKEVIYAPANFNIHQFMELDASEILKIPKLKFENIIFNNYSEESEAKFPETLNSFNSQLNIQTVEINDGKWFSPIFRSLNLEQIEELVVRQVEFTDDQFNEVVGMGQWKKITSLHWCHFPDSVRLEQFVHFKELAVTEFQLTDENLLVVRDILLKSPHFEECVFQVAWVPFNHTGVASSIERIKEEIAEYDPTSDRISIPNSTDYFAWTFDYDHMIEMVMHIQRCTKELRRSRIYYSPFY